MIMPGMLSCNSFLISVCMIILSKALLISSATVQGSHLVEPLCYCVVYCVVCVAPSLYGVVFVPVLRGCICLCLQLCKEGESSPVSFWDGDYVSQITYGFFLFCIASWT